MSVSAQGDPGNAKSIYEFSAKNIDGEEVRKITFIHFVMSLFQVNLSKYQGQVCVLVNVASK